MVVTRDGIPESSGAVTRDGLPDNSGDGRSIGRYETFRSALSISGQRFLPQALTVNGETSLPTFLYTADQISGTTWTAAVSGDLTQAGGGSDPTLDQGSPLGIGGGVDTSVLYAAGKHHEAATSGVNNLTTRDIIFAGVTRMPTTAALGRIMAKYLNTSNGLYLIQSHPSGHISASVGDGTTTVTINSAALTPGAWYIWVLVLDKSGSGQWHINGIASGSAASIATVGSLSSSVLFTIGTAINGTPFNDHVGLVGCWEFDDVGTHVQTAVAVEMRNRICGVYPQLAFGTPNPTVVTRSTEAYLRRDDELFLVGENWPRIAQWDDANGDQMRGYWSEDGATQYQSFSNELDNAAWSKTGTASVTANDAIAPDGNLAADKVELPASADQVLNSDVLTGDIDLDMAVGFWIKRISTTGSLELRHAAHGSTNGHWTIDMSGLPDAWVRITRASPYIAVLTEFDTGDIAGNGRVGVIFYRGAAPDVAVNFHHWNSQSEIGKLEVGSDIVVPSTSPVSRVADVLTYKGDDGNLDRGGVGSAQRGSVVCDVLIPAHDTPGTAPVTAWALSDGGASTERIYLFASSGDVPIFRAVQTSEQWQVIGTTDITDGVKKRLQANYAINDAQLRVNGVSEGTPATSGTPSDDLDKISIGADNADAFNLQGLISNFVIKERR